MSEMGEMGRFWAQNQYFFIFLKIASLAFPEIIPNSRN